MLTVPQIVVATVGVFCALVVVGVWGILHEVRRMEPEDESWPALADWDDDSPPPP